MSAITITGIEALGNVTVSGVSAVVDGELQITVSAKWNGLDPFGLVTSKAEGEICAQLAAHGIQARRNGRMITLAGK